jgi:Enoyl-CoA hydratase/isomerase
MHIRSAAFAVLVCSIACGSLAFGRGEDVGPLVPSRQIWTCHYIATTPKGPLPITARFEVLGEELAEIETIPENLNFSEKYKVLENNETDIVTADVVLATPETVFQDKPHLDFGIVPGDGVNLLWPEVIGSVRGRYFLLTRQELDAETAKAWGAVNEIVAADRLLARAHEIADQLAALPPLTSRYTRIALTQKLRRIIDEAAGYGLALEGMSAFDVARSAAAKS